jgi:putative tricarboxylic transport membrane protein
MTLTTAAVTITVALIYLVMTFRIPDAPIGDAAEPRVFPLMIGATLAALGVALLVQGMKKRATNRSGPSRPRSAIAPEALKIAALASLGVAYGLAFLPLGYVISTILFMLATLAVFDWSGRWATKVGIAVVFSLFIYVLFAKILGVILPPMPGTNW